MVDIGLIENEKWFWRIIDQSKPGKKITHEKQIVNLTRLLTNLAPEEILAFENTFNELLKLSFTWELWGAAYVINGGCSDDAFDYFRSWLIGRGETVFYNAIANPETLKDVIKPAEDYEWEGLSYCASDAYEKVTGKDINGSGKNDDNTELDPKGIKWAEDQLPSLYPQLWKKFSTHDYYENRALKPKVINPARVCFKYPADKIPSPNYWIDELRKRGHDVALRMIGDYETDTQKINHLDYAGYLLQLKDRITKDAMGILIKDLSLNKGMVSVEFEIFDKKLKNVFRDLNLLICEQFSPTTISGDYELTSGQWKEYLTTGKLNV